MPTSPPDTPDLLTQLCQILASVFDVPAERLSVATRLYELPQWSSLSFIVLMTAVETRLGLQPDRERAWDAEDIGTLLAVLQDA